MTIKLKGRKKKSNLQQAILVNLFSMFYTLRRHWQGRRGPKKEGPECDIEVAHIQLETVWELDNESLSLMDFGWG